MALDAPAGLNGAAPGAAVLLQIQELSTLVRRRLEGDSAQYGPVHELPLGRAVLAATLRHDPPTPLEIEHAIERIEDAVMPLRALAAGTDTLVVHDAALHALARQADGSAVDGTVVLERDAVERLFNRLADRAAGRPASQDALPTDAASSAALLLVRELLHHWDLARLRVPTPGT